jgi:nicotinate-nucleotide adenylyltransferase
VALRAREELALERVLLMPAGTPPHKSAGADGSDPGPWHRLRMCQLAVEGVDGLCASALETERDGPSYTVDTLTAIHASNPDAELTFIVGADIAATLESWREPRRLLELARLAVAARSGAARERVLDTVAALSPRADAESLSARLRFLTMGTIEASSSSVRERLARSQPVDDLVAPQVARYIAEHDLYGVASGAVG